MRSKCLLTQRMALASAGCGSRGSDRFNWAEPVSVPSWAVWAVMKPLRVFSMMRSWSAALMSWEPLLMLGSNLVQGFTVSRMSIAKAIGLACGSAAINALASTGGGSLSMVTAVWLRADCFVVLPLGAMVVGVAPVLS